MTVNWALGRYDAPDNPLAAFEHGQDMGRQQVRQNALGELGANPADAAAMARLTQVDPNAAISMQRNARQQVLDQRADAGRDQELAEGEVKKRRETLSLVARITEGVTTPDELEAIKTNPQVRAALPEDFDVGTLTFDHLPQIRQAAAALGPQEEYQVLSPGNGAVVRVGKHSGSYDELRAPDVKPEKPEGPNWKERTLADGSTEWFDINAGLPGHSTSPAPAASSSPTPSASTPRGLRNNNPLNIRPLAHGEWDGQTGVDDGNYAQFGSEQDGWNAAHKNLQAYGKNHGINTVAGVINRWAPAADNNNPQSYAATVAKRLGMAPDAQIDLADPDTREKLLTAMAEVELGQPYSPRAPTGIAGAPAAPPVRPPTIPGSAPKPEKARNQVRQMTAQEVAAAGLPAGTVAQVDDAGRIGVVSKKSDRITDSQRQVADYAHRMVGANEVSNTLADEGIFKPTSQVLISENNGFARLVARNPKDARYLQAAQEWIMAKLRKESGAAIGVQELQNEFSAYYGEPGDSEALLRQKAASRRRATVGMLNQGRAAYEDQFGEVPKQISSRVPGEARAPKSDKPVAKGRPISPQNAARLPKGTRFVGEDGVERIRQ